MSAANRWEPVDYFDIRRGDVLLILTVASHDSPTREAIELLGEDWKPYWKVGATDSDTKLMRLIADEKETA